MKLPPKYRRYIPFLFAGLILLGSFFMSSMDSASSHQASGFFAQWAFDALRPLIEFIKTSANWQIKNGVNYSMRKMAHMGIYFALMTFTMLGIRGFSKKKSLIIPVSLLIVLAFAVLDEFHQIFTDGRNAVPLDVAIDMAGAALVIPCIFFRWLIKIFLQWLRRDWPEEKK